MGPHVGYHVVLGSVWGMAMGGGFTLFYSSWVVLFEDCCMSVGCSGFPMRRAGGTFLYVLDSLSQNTI